MRTPTVHHARQHPTTGSRVASPVTILLCLATLFLCPLVARASQLTLPAVGAADVGLSGNAVALPLNVTSALFHNPAQLSLLPNSATMGALGIRFHATYENNQGFDSRSRELPIAPAFGYVTDRFAPFQFGIGAFGALGFMFNHSAEPEHGVPNNYFTELLSISLAPAISYSLAPNLHLGAAVNQEKLQQGDRFHSMSFELVGGGKLRIPEDMPGRYAAVLFYRGHW